MKNQQRRTTGSAEVALCVLLSVGVLMAGCIPAPAPAPPAPTREQQAEFPSPGPNPEGLAWDGSQLWVIDGKTRQLDRVDPATGKSTQRLEVAVSQPRGLAWDGKDLWTVDAQAGAILRLDPQTGKETKRIDAPKQDVEGDWAITGLAWDGEYLWVSISAAWCSKIVCLQPDSGKTITSFFPQCDPRGLATDGKYLWTIGYNGKEIPSRLNQRALSDNSTEMAQSQKFLSEMKVKDPSALTYGTGVLWVADRATRLISQVPIR
jgi:sugar lactone lactonase YvrE